MTHLFIFSIFVIFVNVQHLFGSDKNGMFTKLNWLNNVKTDQKKYGVAVTDAENDGTFEFIIAGFSGPNIVLRYDKQKQSLENIADDEKFKELQDADGEAIGVCACDIDGDGREEIYFLNTNNAYSGQSSYGDKLFKWRDGKYVDLYSDEVNEKITAKGFAGRSVACIDRKGTGKYSIIIATYSDGKMGKFSLIEMDDSDKDTNIENGIIVLKNVAKEAGIEKATGGRGIVVGPILNKEGISDIFFDNENGANFLFKNIGGGKFKDFAIEMGIGDMRQNGRGVTIGDFNRDGLIDIVYGNWEGNHRIYLQEKSNNGKTVFRNVATPEFQSPSPVRTVIAADFDNDGFTEILVDNIYSPPAMQSAYGYSGSKPNKLYKVKPLVGNEMNIIVEEIDIGEAKEKTGSNTGGAVADIDMDGKLELLLSHEESTGQPLQIYKSEKGDRNNWLRILPLTQYGAPARGASVSLKMSSPNGDVLTQLQVVDGGSGYLCEMEPVAHFGLGNIEISDIAVNVKWPDGKSKDVELSPIDINRVHKIQHPVL